MSVAQAPRPIPLSRVWSGPRVVAEDLTGEDLGDVLELHDGSSAWWVLPRDDDYARGELREIAHALDLDDLALKDLLASDHRAKFEVFGQARLVITNAVSVDQETCQVSVHPVSIIATNRVLICLATPTDKFRPAQLLAGAEEQLAAGGTEAALQLLVKAVVNTYEYAVSWLEESTDDLSGVLFEERPLNKIEQLRAFRLRTALSQLRRLTDPMRAVMTDIVGNPPTVVKGRTTEKHATTSRRWAVIAEQHARTANAADSLREALSSVFDASLALGDVRLNSIMKKLTAWAAIIAVPTLITSFVGMNVVFPLSGTAAGFWAALLLMVVSGIVLYAVFRAKDWV